jgi:hypothetical protein
MRFAQLSTDTTFTVDLPERPSSTPTFTVVGPSGTAVQASGNTSLDGVNTTLSGAAAAGAQAVAVTSATGVAAGERFLLAGAEDDGGEWVTCKSVSATTVTLVRPLRTAKASGATFQSTTVSCAVTGTNIAAVGRHYRLEITYAVASVTQAKLIVPFDVTRYVPASYLTLEDVADIDPLVARRLAAGTWWPALRERVWEMLLRRCAARTVPGSLVGVIDLTTAHAYLVREVVAELAGKDHADQRTLMAARFQEEFDLVMGSTSIDSDQDGAVESHEGAPRSIELVRG